MRIVRRELRVERRPRREHPFGAGQVADIGRNLAGEHRVGIEAALLRPFDLGVPIGPLDQPHHQPAARPQGQIREPIEQRQRPLLIGLHRETEPVPAGQLRGERQRFDEIERQFEPVGLLGVDREADPGVARLTGEPEQRGQQFVHRAFALRHLVARVQSRQLDRNAGGLLDASAARLLADGADRALVGFAVSHRVRHRAGRLAEHVERMTVALPLGLAGARQRLVYRASHDELAGQDAHRGGHGLPPHRLARPRDKAAQNGPEIAFAWPDAVAPQQPSGQHQRPGRGVDEQRSGMSEMPLPVGGGNLVADQLVDGLGIGDAQQRLGETHQSHALLRGQGVFVQKGVEPAPPIRFRRTAATSRRAVMPIRSRASAGSSAAATMRASASVSSRRCQSRIAARSGVSIGGGSRKTQSIGEELVRTQRVAKPRTRTAAASRRLAPTDRLLPRGPPHAAEAPDLERTSRYWERLLHDSGRCVSTT